MRVFSSTSILLVALGVTSMICGETDRPHGLEKVADPETKESEVLRLIEENRSKTPNEGESKLWALVANSEKFPELRRRRAILQLFDRHVRPGLTVGHLSRLLASPMWLKRENISIIRRLAGKIPIRMVPGETVFVVMPKLPPDDSSAVYLRVQGSPTIESLYDGMVGRGSAATALGITAIGICAADADDRRLIKHSHSSD
jgi:hypothetical protein